jgi:hypothetical protein
MSTALPLYVKLELRAITNSALKRDRAVMMLVARPVLGGLHHQYCRM